MNIGTAPEKRAVGPEKNIVEQEKTSESPPGTPVAHFRGNVRSFDTQTNPSGDVEKFLKIRVTLVTSDGETTQAVALVDTGAEVSLIKKGLIAHTYEAPARRRLKLIAANNEVVEGGSMELNLDVQLDANNIQTKEKIVVNTPTSLYVANIAEEMILSHKWFAHRDIQVHSRQNGLCTTVDKVQIWVHE